MQIETSGIQTTTIPQARHRYALTLAQPVLLGGHAHMFFEILPEERGRRKIEIVGYLLDGQL